MNDRSTHPAAVPTLGEGVHVLLSNVREDVRDRYRRCENRIRKSPASAVLGGVAAGYLLHRMPVRAILVTQVRVLSALVPPALFLFGAAKIYEFLQKQKPGAPE